MNFNVKLICFKAHYLYYALNGIYEIKSSNELSELAGAQLGIVKHVIDDEVKNLGSTHFHTDTLFLLSQGFLKLFLTCPKCADLHIIKNSFLFLIQSLLFLDLTRN